jgi:uncharacterized protein (DUF2132 family)
MEQKNNPLHGYTLETIVKYLFAFYGWEQLYEQVPVNCFKVNPSVQSSLRFLRKTPWARQRVETIFIYLTRNGADPALLNIVVKE